MQCASKTRFASRVVVVGTVAALAGAPLRGGPAQAGDDAGVRDFIGSQAARAAAPEPRAQVAASTPTEAQIQRYLSPGREAKRTTAPARVLAAPARPPKVQYAKFSEPEARQTPKPQRAGDLPSDPVAALLRDPTLQPGDIVVLRDGPKVFSGRGKFEAVEQSRLVSKRERKAVLAMTQPAANLAGQARQKLALPSATNSDGPALASVRVVYPQLRTQ
jgi:hypothetical protein